MLSYKHGYHAGNHADVLKHIVLIYLYNIQKKRNKSITYIDTHSGDGKYNYSSKYMDKNKEYKYGIKKIEKYQGTNSLIINYLKKLLNITKDHKFYPGSPFIISNMSTNLDKLYFCELHNNEFINLKKNFSKFTNIKVINTNGFDYIEKNLNNDKSFFILIDPSYEIKEDFEKINYILDNLEKKYVKSKIIIWYPILSYEENDHFIEDIRKKGISNLINIELPINSNNDDIGMKGSGLLLVNFNDKKILRDLKLLIKDLHIYLKQDDDVYNPKARYL